MTNGCCPTCGAVTSTPLYRCRCASDESKQAAVCRPMVDSAKLTREGLERLNEVLREAAP